MDEILPKVRPVQGTADVLGRLKGRKAVFSNAPSFYVRGLAAELGLSDCFDALFGTDDFGLLYKPAEAAYLTVCAAMKADPADCVMVDDSADNLAAAKKLGMKTVWFGSGSHLLPFVDCAAPDMAALAAWAQEAV